MPYLLTALGSVFFEALVFVILRMSLAYLYGIQGPPLPPCLPACLPLLRRMTCSSVLMCFPLDVHALPVLYCGQAKWQEQKSSACT